MLVHNAECQAWINHDTYNEVRNKFGEKCIKRFVDAMKNGFVRAKGQNGIKELKGKGLVKNGIVYTHEIKVVKGQEGNWRIFGFSDPKSKHFIFNWFREGLH